MSLWFKKITILPHFLSLSLSQGHWSLMHCWNSFTSCEYHWWSRDSNYRRSSLKMGALARCCCLCGLRPSSCRARDALLWFAALCSPIHCEVDWDIYCQYCVNPSPKTVENGAKKNHVLQAPLLAFPIDSHPPPFVVIGCSPSPTMLSAREKGRGEGELNLRHTCI